MIKKISIVQYRRLKNIDIVFSEKTNLIAGVNGTCKSSLLHMVSNSFQRLTMVSALVEDKKCLNIIKSINANLNPKIESLTRGDKLYRDPARGIKGTLYSVEYSNGTTLSFRKHNSEIQSRYAIKPHYSAGTEDTLPELPVIYLGLSRLYPFGEFQKDDAIKKITNDLPEFYKNELNALYKDLTRIDITNSTPQSMENIKVRADFDSQKPGVDSNTISSGEENIYIILTALLSLRYYYESLLDIAKKNVNSILLLDEFDATLHPALQIKLLDIVRDYANKYHIQMIATTHSLSLLEYALRCNDNVIYIVDNLTDIEIMKDPDIYRIKMDLKTIARQDIYADKKIPVFTEDSEARIFLTKLLDYGFDHIANFNNVRHRFYLVDANLGCDNLRQIFKDTKLAPLMQAICILDGDQSPNLGQHILQLPGGASPEKLLLEYADKLYESNDKFWYTEEVDYQGYRKPFYYEHIQSKYHAALNECKNSDNQNGQEIKKKLRKMLKELWKEHPGFFELLTSHWIYDSNNQTKIACFFKQLNILFYKTSEFHGISRKDWPIQKTTGDSHE